MASGLLGVAAQPASTAAAVHKARLDKRRAARPDMIEVSIMVVRALP
jgi:hypothetical protein